LVASVSLSHQYDHAGLRYAGCPSSQHEQAITASFLYDRRWQKSDARQKIAEKEKMMNIFVTYILRQSSLGRPAQVKHKLLYVGSHLKTLRNLKHLHRCMYTRR